MAKLSLPNQQNSNKTHSFPHSFLLLLLLHVFSKNRQWSSAISITSMFTSKTPHFFKVFLQKTVQDRVLGIPTKFVSKYGNQLSSFVKLEVPSGVIWQVELTKTNGRVQLQKGWREFADHYSLELGSFVVFRYQGNGYFHVLIFDKTASEIEYPYSSTENDDFCDEVSASRKSKEKREFPCPLPQKEIRTESPNQPGRNSKYPDDNKPSGINLGNLKGQLDARRSVKTEAFTCVQMLTATEKTRALQIARLSSEDMKKKEKKKGMGE